MRWAFIILAWLVVASSPAESRAEKVKANQATSLLNRPGERGKVLISVDEGKSMTVLAKQGRWLKVRVSGRTGFVPRSKVDMAEEDIVRNTRRRSFVDGRGTKRGFGGEQAPEDRVGADSVGDGVGEAAAEDEGGGDDDEDADEPVARSSAKPGKPGGKGKPAKPAASDEGDEDDIVVDDEEAEAEAVADEADTRRKTARVKSKQVAFNDPSEDSDESFAATPGMALYPTGEKKASFTEVENDEGDLGWLPDSALEVDESSGGGDDGDGDGDGDGGGAGPSGPISVGVRLGVTYVTQGLRSAGGAIAMPDNYNLSTAAATLALGGSYLRPYGAKFLIGGEAMYEYAKALGGFDVMGGGSTSVSLHNFRLRALGGYDLKGKRGLALFARLGFHYQSYQVANVEDLTKNTGTIPSEILQAPSIGIGLTLPRMTAKLGLRLSLDAVVFGSLKQTKNIEDGADPSASAFVTNLGVTYRWKPGYDLLVQYELNYLSASFGAPLATSKRMHTGTSTTRTDFFHGLTFGLSKAF